MKSRSPPPSNSSYMNSAQLRAIRPTVTVGAEPDGFSSRRGIKRSTTFRSRSGHRGTIRPPRNLEAVVEPTGPTGFDASERRPYPPQLLANRAESLVTSWASQVTNVRSYAESGG